MLRLHSGNDSGTASHTLRPTIHFHTSQACIPHQENHCHIKYHVPGQAWTSPVSSLLFPVHRQLHLFFSRGSILFSSQPSESTLSVFISFPCLSKQTGHFLPLIREGKYPVFSIFPEASYNLYQPVLPCPVRPIPPRRLPPGPSSCTGKSPLCRFPPHDPR